MDVRGALLGNLVRVTDSVVVTRVHLGVMEEKGGEAAVATLTGREAMEIGAELIRLGAQALKNES